jgi:hypothetical protein
MIDRPFVVDWKTRSSGLETLTARKSAAVLLTYRPDDLAGKPAAPLM